jgi:hypothetical protein
MTEVRHCGLRPQSPDLQFEILNQVQNDNIASFYTACVPCKPADYDGFFGVPGILGVPGIFGAPSGLGAAGAAGAAPEAAMAAMKSASVAPQLLQTFAVVAFFVPHFGHSIMPGACAWGSFGSSALQNGQLSGLKFGETIFLWHSGQMSGPDVVSGGRKHMVVLAICWETLLRKDCNLIA